MSTIADTARIHPGVRHGPDLIVQDFVIIGVPSSDDTTPATTIGKNAVLRSHTVIYAGNRIGDHFTTGHGVLVRESNTIGNHVSVGSHSIVEHHVTIGNGVRIHSNAFIPEYSILEDDAWIGPNVCLTNADHPKCPNAPDCFRGVTVRQGAKVGANATLLPGVVVGRGALVGAGAVVTKDVPDNAVVAGNPARVVRNVQDLVCPLDQTTHPYAE